MADSYGSVSINIRLDADGAYPLPTYPGYGSERHVANSSRSVVQYTGTGVGLLSVDLFAERADYDALLAIYVGFPRLAHTLTIGGDNYGQWFIDSLSAPRSLIGRQIFASAVFKEAP